MYTVEEIMSTELVTVTPDDTVAVARDLMSKKKIRHLPVVDNGGKLVGLVTQTDILAALSPFANAMDESGQNEMGAAMRVGDIMTTTLETVDERADIRAAARQLEAHKHGCLPVVTDGSLKGIVTDTDFVAVAINLLEQMEATEPPEEY